ncbi:MAG: amidase [Burkholderiales bacterium]|nr:MAG: amidase [Burkholderiales bacterium]
MTTTGIDPTRVSALELARLLREGVLGAVESTRAFLARIDEVEPEVQAWAHLDPEHALKQAEELELNRSMGRPIGPLYGVPVGVKDIIDAHGLPSEDGTVLHAGRRPIDDATVVTRLREAGAIILGKTVTTELATFSPGKTRNPWNAEHTPGGSSSGSAAAVAAGMVPLAIGTQTNGSVIRPAAYCGVVGFKPTFGQISRFRILAQSRALDQVGVFARTVGEAAWLAELLTGFDENDPDTRLAARPDWLEVARQEPPMPPRLAMAPTPIWSQAEPDTREAFEELHAMLNERLAGDEDRTEGEPSVPWIELAEAFGQAWECHRLIHESDLAHHLRQEYDRGRDQLSATLCQQIERGRTIAAVDYLLARERAAGMARLLDEYLEDYDAFVTPATAGTAPAGLESTGSPAFCTLWTLAGLPAITLPLMRGGNGLPLGVQLVGARGNDGRLLRTARWLSELVQRETADEAQA